MNAVNAPRRVCGASRASERRPSKSASCKAVSGGNQFVHRAELIGRMAGIRHNAKISLWESARQFPGALQRTHDIVAALDDYRRNVAQARDVIQQLVLVRKKATVHEVVTLDTREGETELIPRAAPDVVLVLKQVARACLPHAPSARRLLAHEGVLRR